MKGCYSTRVKLAKWLCYVLVVCLINTIVDSPARYRTIDGQLAYNEIESIYEWLVEEVADWEDAVPEQEDNNTEFNNIKKDKYDWAYQPDIGAPLQVMLPAVSFIQKQSYYFPSPVSDAIYPPPEI
jgi:hypothetical protein